MVKLDELWKETVFDRSDPGENYCEMIIQEGTAARLIDLPDDAPLPEYYDRVLFERAQKYYKDYNVFIATTNVLGVMILFGIESILDILACTKQSSTPVTAYKRYAETLLLIENLFKDSPEDSKSLCYRSLLAIRKKHKHGSAIGERRVNKFINQRDMAITQNSFMGYVVAHHHKFGLPLDPANLYALCHFWRVVGYMLGIDERFNICSGDLPTITSRSVALFRHMIVPGLMHAPKDFQMMTEAYFDGLLGLSSEFKCDKFIFITKRMSQVPGFYATEAERANQLAYMKKYPHYIPNEKEILENMRIHPKRSKEFGLLKWSYRWDILFTDFLLEVVVPKSAIMRGIFNLIHQSRLFFLKNFPFLAMVQFGYKNAYVRVLDG